MCFNTPNSPNIKVSLTFLQGSSAIQVVPEMAKKVKHLTNFVRSKS